MHFIRLQCPACGAPVKIVASQAAITCDYCGVRFAVVGSASQPTLRPASAQPASAQPDLHSRSPAGPAVYPHPAISNRRGCLWALLTWFFIGPLTAALILLPFASLLERSEDGTATIPDALAFCLVIFVVAMTVYAFIHFRRSDNTLWGYIIAPWRAGRRALSKRSSHSDIP